MYSTRRVLFAALILVASLAVTTTAFALPRQCDEICTSSSPCWLRCAEGSWVTTCCFGKTAVDAEGEELTDWLAAEEPNQTPVPAAE